MQLIVKGLMSPEAYVLFLISSDFPNCPGAIIQYLMFTVDICHSFVHVHSFQMESSSWLNSDGHRRTSYVIITKSVSTDVLSCNKADVDAIMTAISHSSHEFFIYSSDISSLEREMSKLGGVRLPTPAYDSCPFLRLLFIQCISVYAASKHFVSNDIWQMALVHK